MLTSDKLDTVPGKRASEKSRRELKREDESNTIKRIEAIGVCYFVSVLATSWAHSAPSPPGLHMIVFADFF